MSALLTLDSLCATTPDGRLLFNGLTLTVGARERIGLVGRKGSGKSTLLSIIAGNVAPTGGHLTLSARIGMLAQDWLEAMSGRSPTFGRPFRARHRAQPITPGGVRTCFTNRS
jgi:ATPase subunit of ABC transporter with duplicated ATPase domains